MAQHKPAPWWLWQNENGIAKGRPVTPAQDHEPDYEEAARAYDALIKRAQDILAHFITPDGHDADQACSELLDLLDGPPWREAQRKYAAARSKAEGRM